MLNTPLKPSEVWRNGRGIGPDGQNESSANERKKKESPDGQKLLIVNKNFSISGELQNSKSKLTATENSLNPLSADRAELSFFFL